MRNAVQQWFANVAHSRPNAVALFGNGSSITYGELERLAAAITQRLVNGGAKSRDICCLACSRPDHYVAGMIGIMAAGAVAMPLDAATPDERIRQTARVARPALLLADDGLASRFRALMPRGLDITEIKLGLLSDQEIEPAMAEAELPAIGPDDPCYVFFTSGSTGEPKGIVGRTSALTHFIDWEIATFAVDENDVVAMLTSPGFDAVLRDVFTPLCAGGRIAVLPDRNIISDPEALAGWLAATGVTLLHTTPSLLRRLLALPLLRSQLPRLKRVMVAGEALLVADVEQWFERFGDGVELVNLYGPSETTMVKMFHRISPADLQRARIPIGKPMEGCRAIVLDDAMNPVGVGAVGEIYLRTPHRSLGYCNRPELTAEAFIENPFGNNSDDRIYRTGDLGRTREDGNFEFFGRRDDQLKVRGVRVEPAEAAAILRRHSDVLDAAVVGHEMTPGDVQLCAYVVLKGATDFDVIRAHVAQHLPDASVPTVFIQIDKIPRTLSGKLDRQALPNPQSPESRRSRRGIPARTPLERGIVEIWQDLLEIGEFGVTDNFFTVGGHSLLAMQVLARVESAFSVPLPLHDFLLEPTVETLAHLLEMELMAKASTDAELQRLIDAEDLE